MGFSFFKTNVEAMKFVTSAERTLIFYIYSQVNMDSKNTELSADFKKIVEKVPKKSPKKVARKNVKEIRSFTTF
jgi:predicted negative regulator of RcsB-dependent stress response